jgi:folylpolyglutamate synthase/dihydropteroate synthase
VSDRPSRTAPDPAGALALADGDPVVVAGSLYLVGAIRGMLTGTNEEA